jgi:hypothetical protein
VTLIRANTRSSEFGGAIPALRVNSTDVSNRQATPKTAEMYGGSGLGLNISRKLCHLHGGEVGVSSRIDHGSTFGFFFKVKRSEQPQDHHASSETEGSTPQDKLGEDQKSKSMDYSSAAEAVENISRADFQQDDSSHKSKV